ncbi:MAG: FCD domain-containing protein [Bifidobacteriaceae bacterium]|jgi:DNA-binding FadR family transcriptional regulator|nr:FCD domain-containing protein [Bifidobacteriaceae bacterium]
MAVSTSVHDRVLDAWGMGIVSGAYPPGSRIAIGDEVTAANASRTVAREAVRVLESMGLVTVKRRAGAVVNPPDQWHVFDPQLIAWRLRGPETAAQILQLSELRNAVEPTAARLAAANATPDQWAALTEAAIGLVAHSRAADAADYLAADIRFHRTLLQASGNPMFAALGGMVEAILRGRTEQALMPSTANPVALRLHGDIAAAVAGGDAAAAEAASRALIEEADQAVQEAARQS